MSAALGEGGLHGSQHEAAIVAALIPKKVEQNLFGATEDPYQYVSAT